MNDTSFVLTTEFLFDGLTHRWQPDMAVEIADGEIMEVRKSTPKDRSGRHVPRLCPGFIDLQINGAGDVLFNADPTPATLATMAKAAHKGGTAYIMPTFITAEGTEYRKAMKAVETALGNGILGILGIHLEGPFVNPEKSGIHPRGAVRAITPNDVDILTRFTDGPIMVTVAPEMIDDISLRNLVGAGVVVFAGHSNTDHTTATRAFDTGVRGTTHLFNAMSQMGSRSPGLVGATLSHGVAYAGIIADGFHVDPACVAVAAQAMPERLFLVTDAMQTLAGKSKSFDLYGKKITLDDGRLTDKNGTLAGAHLSMDQAVRNLIRMTGIPDTMALAMASTIPARAIGMDDQLGVIAPGYRAGITLLDNDLHPAGTVVDGVMFP